MKIITVTQARKDLGDIFGDVNYYKERVILSNHRKRIAMVPIEDLEKLEALENAEDIREAKLALQEIKEKGAVSLKEMKRRLRDIP